MSGTHAAPKTDKDVVEIKLAHSPDSDDAFMFYALATHKLATPGYRYAHVLSDIQTLNEAAHKETYDVTALSFAAYPDLRDKYILLDCGASFGEGYGPIVVSAKPMKKEDLAGRKPAVAIAGPLHRRAHRLTLGERQVVAHPDLVPVAKDRRPGLEDDGLPDIEALRA